MTQFLLTMKYLFIPALLIASLSHSLANDFYTDPADSLIQRIIQTRKIINALDDAEKLVKPLTDHPSEKRWKKAMRRLKRYYNGPVSRFCPEFPSTKQQQIAECNLTIRDIDLQYARNETPSENTWKLLSLIVYMKMRYLQLQVQQVQRYNAIKK